MTITISELVGAALLVLGTCFCVLGVYGVLRLPDFYNRLHAAGTVLTLGAAGVLLSLLFLAVPVPGSKRSPPRGFSRSQRRWSPTSFPGPRTARASHSARTRCATIWPRLSERLRPHRSDTGWALPLSGSCGAPGLGCRSCKLRKPDQSQSGGMMRKRRTSAMTRLVASGVTAYVGWQLLQQLREVNLAGRVVLITGGSRGLGFLLAREFASEGCRVAICARDPQELEAAADQLKELGSDVLALRCDVTDRAQVADTVARVTDHFGRVDILVNNASVIQSAPVGAMRAEDFEQAMAVNFWGTVYMTLEVLPQMRQRGDGRIVNITSIGAKVAIPHLLPYDCAKFAALGFSEGLRAELAREGLTVTTIVPGLMRTGSPVNAFFKGDAEKEYTWFSLSAATPVTAMSAERAARRIVLATRRGEAEVTLSWQAKLLRLVHDAFPGATADLIGVVNRLLPTDESQREDVRGMELATPLSPSLATAPMNRAAREYNQYAGQHQPSEQHAKQVGLRRTNDE